MISGEKDYIFCKKTLESIFSDSELVEKTLERFVDFKNKKIERVDQRIQGLLHRCGNINAVKEFLTYLVFETYQEEESDLSYQMARLGYLDTLNTSKVFSGMKSKEQQKLLKLMKWQVDRVKNMCDFICRNIDAPVDKNVLDVGCGIGQLSYQLAKQGMNVTAIDLDVKSAVKIQPIVLAQFNYASKVSFKQGNALDLSNINEKYDLISLADVVEHITNKKTLFREIDKKLKLNGGLIIHTDNLTKLRLLMLVKRIIYLFTFRNPKSYNLAWSGGDGGHVGLQTPELLIELLNGFGYKSICNYDQDNVPAQICPKLFANGFMLFSVKKEK